MDTIKELFYGDYTYLGVMSPKTAVRRTGNGYGILLFNFGCINRIYPSNEIFGAAALALGSVMSLFPYSCKVHAVNAVTMLESKRQIDLRGHRCCRLLNSGTDAPILCRLGCALALAAFQQIVKRRIHMHALFNGVAKCVRQIHIRGVFGSILAVQLCQNA